jgi:hypothetical protein
MLVTSQVRSILLGMLEMLEIELYPLGNWEPMQTIFSHQSIDYHLISLFSNVRLGFGPNP